MKYSAGVLTFVSEQDKDVLWRGKPWVGPAMAARTIGAIVVAALAYLVLSTLGILALSIFGFPLYALVYELLAIVWLASILGLVVMRASFRYVLRQRSLEVDRGIVSKRSLVVSPSAFSELEVDQGVAGRLLDYGSLEVRSQGGQQLNLRLIRDPNGVSAKIRGVMTVPTVKIATDEPVSPTPSG